MYLHKNFRKCKTIETESRPCLACVKGREWGLAAEEQNWGGQWLCCSVSLWPWSHNGTFTKIHSLGGFCGIESRTVRLLKKEKEKSMKQSMRGGCNSPSWYVPRETLTMPVGDRMGDFQGRGARLWNTEVCWSQRHLNFVRLFFFPG